MASTTAMAEKVAGNVVLAAGARLAMVLGVPIILFLLTSGYNSIAEIGKRLQTVEMQMATNIATQTHVNGALTGEVTKLSSTIDRLGVTLSPLSQMVERMTQMDRRVTSVEVRNDAQEERLGRLGESVIELRAIIEPMVRASQQDLPGARGVRR